MQYNDKYNEDLLKLIIKNKDKFQFSILDVVNFIENDYTISIIKSSNNRYAIYIRYKGDKVHDFKIDFNNKYYNNIKNIIEPLLKQQNDDIKNERLLIKILGKDNRFSKIKKIQREIDEEEQF